MHYMGLRGKKQGVLQLMSKAKRKCHCLVYFPRRTSIKSPSCFVGVPHFFYCMCLGSYFLVNYTGSFLRLVLSRRFLNYQLVEIKKQCVVKTRNPYELNSREYILKNMVFSAFFIQAIRFLLFKQSIY